MSSFGGKSVQCCSGCPSCENGNGSKSPRENDSQSKQDAVQGARRTETQRLTIDTVLYIFDSHWKPGSFKKYFEEKWKKDVAKEPEKEEEKPDKYARSMLRAFRSWSEKRACYSFLPDRAESKQIDIWDASTFEIEQLSTNANKVVIHLRDGKSFDKLTKSWEDEKWENKDVTLVGDAKTLGDDFKINCKSVVFALPYLVTIGDDCMSECNKLRTVFTDGLSSLREIGRGCFANCIMMEGVNGELRLNGLVSLETIGASFFTQTHVPKKEEKERRQSLAVIFDKLPKLTTIRPFFMFKNFVVKSVIFPELPQLTRIGNSFTDYSKIYTLTFGDGSVQDPLPKLKYVAEKFMDTYPGYLNSNEENIGRRQTLLSMLPLKFKNIAIITHDSWKMSDALWKLMQRFVGKQEMYEKLDTAYRKLYEEGLFVQMFDPGARTELQTKINKILLEEDEAAVEELLQSFFECLETSMNRLRMRTRIEILKI
jgi:hypothetical protein